jgi:MurNAc alpha-1-phosphate uridylyltransferase
LFQRTAGAIGYDANGDYFLDPLGVPRRRGEREIAPFLFSGIQLLHRRLFDTPTLPSPANGGGLGIGHGVAERRFSLNRLYDRAESAGRLHAIVHDGEWYHIGTPDGLAATRARLSSHRIER